MEAVYDRTYTNTPDNWAALVYQELQKPGAKITHLTELASHYLSHLVIACKRSSFHEEGKLSRRHFTFQVRNPGDKKTPQDTVHPTPNLRRIEEIEELLEQAQNKRSQSALKDLVRFELVG